MVYSYGLQHRFSLLLPARGETSKPDFYHREDIRRRRITVRTAGGGCMLVTSRAGHVQEGAGREAYWVQERYPIYHCAGCR